VLFSVVDPALCQGQKRDLGRVMFPLTNFLLFELRIGHETQLVKLVSQFLIIVDFWALEWKYEAPGFH
jgi:hypothetical protein